jgi:hypothetical protein
VMEELCLAVCVANSKLEIYLVGKRDAVFPRSFRYALI